MIVCCILISKELCDGLKIRETELQKQLELRDAENRDLRRRLVNRLCFAAI